MTQKVRRKRRLRFTGVVFVVFMFSFTLFLATSIFLKSFNVHLNIIKQDYQSQIAAIQNGNETLQYDVKELSKYDRIINIIDNDMYADENVVHFVSD